LTSFQQLVHKQLKAKQEFIERSKSFQEVKLKIQIELKKQNFKNADDFQKEYNNKVLDLK